MGTPKVARVPMLAVPNTLRGEAACAFADELGTTVDTHALRGARPLSTEAARAFLASGSAQGHDFSSAIWIITSYDVSEILR